eukprot:scaffold10555_cov90-Skeletonema_marinoi.AAC.4
MARASMAVGMIIVTITELEGISRLICCCRASAAVTRTKSEVVGGWREDYFTSKYSKRIKIEDLICDVTCQLLQQKGF